MTATASYPRAIAAFERVHASGLQAFGRLARLLHGLNWRTCLIEEEWFTAGYEAAIVDLKAPGVPAAPPLPALVLGVYRHYKGGVYNVVAEGAHTETGEVLVAYYRDGDYETLYLRPKAQFLGLVTTGDGTRIQRFWRPTRGEQP